MNLTFFHWGVHGWIVYVVVGLLLAFVCYRWGLPMTVRSCFYPLIGDKIYGWMGDIIDVLSICGTMFGVCTSLGLGAIQLNTGDEKGLEVKINLTTTQPIIIRMLDRRGGGGGGELPYEWDGDANQKL